jgi:hypothetical protein
MSVNMTTASITPISENKAIVHIPLCEMDLQQLLGLNAALGSVLWRMATAKNRTPQTPEGRLRPLSELSHDVVQKTPDSPSGSVQLSSSLHSSSGNEHKSDGQPVPL